MQAGAMTTQIPIRVLLADDHQVVRAGIRQLVGASGDIGVIAKADDGEQAIEMIEAHKPDVAVLDIQMPKKTGIDVTVPGSVQSAVDWRTHPDRL